MRVRRQVERHAVQIGGEIRAVIQIEAAQKILVGLSAARVLGDDDAGTVSKISPLRRIGRSASCSAPVVPCVAESAMPSRLSCRPSRRLRAVASDSSLWVRVQTLQRGVAGLLSHGGTSNQTSQNHGDQPRRDQTKPMQQ
jgi:hypothetical protein